MTYREKLQGFIQELENSYDKAKGMRDNAFDQGVFNQVRGHLYQAFQTLKNHDDNLTDGQAQSEW